MLVSYAPRTPVYHPATMSKPVRPFFKRQKTDSSASRPVEFVSRSGSPAGSFSLNNLQPHDSPRVGSPAGSFYSHSSASSPSIDSTSSAGSAKDFPATPSLTLAPGWLSRSPRSTRSMHTTSPTESEFPSPPDTPMEVPEAELRRRQLQKAARILGEAIPLELVLQPRHPLVKAFPDPPPRRSTESPQPGQQPKEMSTERRAGKLARRASLSLSTFASKFRGGPTNHSRDSSQDSSSSDQSSPPVPAMPRRRSIVATSPIMFNFPLELSPSRAQFIQPSSPSTPDGGLVIDIRSPPSSILGHDDEEATPVREYSSPLARSHSYSHSEILPRVVPMPTHSHAESEQIYMRSETPFSHMRPETPFADVRPGTPFIDLDDGEDTASAAYLSPVSRKERGQGWSGEWNQRDMQDVIQKLRSLK
ncbi:hypothetical protein DFH07DRAFT_843039 [Mycena maculata]|uniref:Uncharacterized protein n=1 Tax=Mycena maculata TaxID=230809 RepID=A0AAD7I6I4_9AGAR|nr:hypothetical protein DFH07DRAFT_843039 [Mycena maculata]